MKKKSKMTYADKAKAIMSRYKKRLGENFERYDKMASECYIVTGKQIGRAHV